MSLTIITPSLNYGRFLGDCLQSVAAQMQDIANDEKMWAGRPRSLMIEHLVIDAGSSDDSALIAAKFPHITWIQEPDEGMSDAINKGFDQAKCDWIMWLNADDRLKPKSLANVIRFLEKSNADVVYGNWDFVDESGNYLRSVTAPRWSKFVHIHHHCLVGSTAAFYRKSSVIDQGYRLRKDFRYVMDGEFYARLDSIGKHFEHMPVIVADFRLHGDNASIRHSGISRDMKTILAAEYQHVESRSIRRAYGITLSKDPYLNGLMDGILWILARTWKFVLKCIDR